ncbi:hypothetical protein B5V89_15695 [Heyndrickxia sporothermodurans]|uniref:hypothetical protein n=1 Tax=Heyndrickxia sporothermodurans TaxID=46224 RepID=UPI000D3A5CDA|nr:hypothetical protein [Heyndrickxia sporothermodurans]PTY77101.1 hypothetical protein B5V89_15695 [Heyndrickxia sporothermodurans]
MVFEPTQINLSDLKINSSDHSSAITLGSAVIVGRRVVAKKSQAIGQLLSDHTTIISSKSFTIDDDLEDFFRTKGLS